MEIIDAVKKIIAAGIPIMGHLGLMPQSINKYGTYTVRAKDEEEAEKLLSDAHLLEEAGCFALVLEKIPASLAERVARELTIPVIGIGEAGGCGSRSGVLWSFLDDAGLAGLVTRLIVRERWRRSRHSYFPRKSVSRDR